MEILGETSLGSVCKLQKTSQPIAFKFIKNTTLINQLFNSEKMACEQLEKSSNIIIKYYGTEDRLM